MTDNEIVEALKLCTTQDGSIPCYDCPYWDDGVQKCEGLNHTDLLGLINRQKAEIDSLKKEIQITKDAYNMLQTKNEIAKSEAVKEFASRLKYGVPQEYGVISCYDVDNLVKEMVGDEE